MSLNQERESIAGELGSRNAEVIRRYADAMNTGDISAAVEHRANRDDIGMMRQLGLLLALAN